MAEPARSTCAWSPDGAAIAYAGGSPLRVWIVSAAGGAPRAVSGPGGDGERYPWRFWLDDEPTVSSYRAAVRR